MLPQHVSLILALLSALASPASADITLVEDGRPRAEIVISAAPTRMQRLAAHEFRQQVEKITGARLPLLNQPSGAAVKVFIGESPACPVKAEGLKEGAYRIVTGPDWLALVGDDRDYTPAEPWARSNTDVPRAQAEWEKIVGAPYGMPMPGLYKNKLKLPGDTGLPDGAPAPAKSEHLEIWSFDERGSFNAVCGLLYRLGARWFLPGELGEVLPSMRTLRIPATDETVRPDFRLRQFNTRFGVVGTDAALWMMRLGFRNDERFEIAHGLARMTNREEVFAKHPDWFALYGSKRDFRPGDSKSQLCYSNEELLRETVRQARVKLDTYGFETVSIMPPDAYTAICQCEKCRGKDDPSRGERGLLSDHVWDFVNRVAREIAKTHPKARVLNCAYGTYTLPPARIDKLEPNVQVCIVGGRRPVNKAGAKGAGEAAPEALRAGWAAKTGLPLMIFENYPFTDRGWYLPSFSARALVDTVKASKGLSEGEDIWLTVRQDFDRVNIGFNHFLVYFTARSYWGGQDIDGEAMLSDYCERFYGPAAASMHDFFTYCEQHWAAMETDKAKADEALALFDKAKAATSPDSVHARRLALIDDYLKGLRMKSQQLAQKRGPLPKLRLVSDAEGVVIDGRLDDAYWQKCPSSANGRLRELQTGRVPTFGTSFKAGWQGGRLLFAIRCEERRGERPVSTTTRTDDPAIWRGDLIEIQIATESHSYYQIAVSPAGHVVDLDRGAPKGQWFGWDSKAEAAVHVAEDHWTVEIALPVTQDENDPLHQMLGRKPTQSLPWHVNLCRQRTREDGQELSAYSPTGTGAFHEPMKFAYLYAGRSHDFEADPEVSDFALDFQKAVKERTAAPFLALAEREKISDFQRAAALEQAALFEPSNAPALLERIPVEAVRKTVHMRHLFGTAKPADIIAQYGSEDFSRWPFWQRAEGLQLRGRAHLALENGTQAEADLAAAVDLAGDPRARDGMLLLLARNREQNLRKDDTALAAYRRIVDGRERLGSADEFAALQGIARILARQGKHEEALATLRRARPEDLKGVWQKNIQKSIEEIEQACRAR